MGQGIQCPFYLGFCADGHAAAAFFSLNSNLKKVQVSPFLPLMQLLLLHHKCTTGYTWNQCLNQSPLYSVFHQYVYCGLDPAPPSWTSSSLLFKEKISSSLPSHFTWEHSSCGAREAYAAFSHYDEELAYLVSWRRLYSVTVH